MTDAMRYQQLILHQTNNTPVRLDAFGRAITGVENNRLAGWSGTNRAVLVIVFKQAGANVIQTVDRIRAVLPQLERWMPMPLLIGAALVAVYVVLGMLYESLAHPLTILSTLPSAGLGALLAMLVTGFDLSLVSFIGIILLMGIVKKNAIMMIDFALEVERHEGLTPREAIYKACVIRFRPIMMTTVWDSPHCTSRFHGPGRP